MTDSPLFAPLTTPIVRPLRWIGLALAVLIAALGASFGLAQSAPVQYVILTTVATFAPALITLTAPLKLASSTTGAGTQTFTNSPCAGLTTERWIPAQITGQSGTWNIPACQ